MHTVHPQKSSINPYSENSHFFAFTVIDRALCLVAHTSVSIPSVTFTGGYETSAALRAQWQKDFPPQNMFNKIIDEWCYNKTVFFIALVTFKL